MNDECYDPQNGYKARGWLADGSVSVHLWRDTLAAVFLAYHQIWMFFNVTVRSAMK